MACDELPTTIATVLPAGIADGCGHRDQFLGDNALAPLEPPGRHAVAQLLSGRGAQLLLDLVEIGLQLGYGAR